MIRTIVSPGKAETIAGQFAVPREASSLQRRALHPRPRKQTECPAQPDVKANQTQQEHQQGVKPNLNGANVPPPALRHPAAVLHNTPTVDAPEPAPGSPRAVAEQQQRQQASGSRTSASVKLRRVLRMRKTRSSGVVRPNFACSMTMG